MDSALSPSQFILTMDPPQSPSILQMKKYQTHGHDAKRMRFDAMLEIEASAAGSPALISASDGAVSGGSDEEMVYEEPIRIFTSCSPEKLHGTLSQLSPEAKEIVKDLGLGGLLRLPEKCIVDRRLSFWLLHKLSSESMTIPLGNDQMFCLEEETTQLVLGVRSGSVDVPNRKNVLAKKVIRKIAKILMIDPETKHIAPSDLCFILQRDVISPLTSKEKDMIRAAVVLLACTYLFGPSGKGATIPLEIMSIATNPRMLKRYNWPKYVVGCLRSAAKSVEQQLLNEHKYIIIDGCLPLLQVSLSLVFSRICTIISQRAS